MEKFLFLKMEFDINDKYDDDRGDYIFKNNIQTS